MTLFGLVTGSVLVTCVLLASDRSESLPFKSRLRKSLEGKEQLLCTQTEAGIDYVTMVQLDGIRGVPSAEDCRNKCQGTRKCGVWTWGFARNMPGVTDVCFLKRLDDGAAPMKAEKYGVVSGYPCHGKHASEHKLELTFVDTMVTKVTTTADPTRKPWAWDPSNVFSWNQASSTTAPQKGSSTSWKWEWKSESTSTATTTEWTWEQWTTTTTSPWAWKSQSTSSDGTSTSTATTTTTSTTRQSTTTTTTSTSTRTQQSCHQMDENVDYWTVSGLYGVQHVKTFQKCYELCQRTEGCGAWTWGKARNWPGITDVCYLKELGHHEKLRKQPKYGVISGLVCESNSTKHNEKSESHISHDDIIAMTTQTETTTSQWSTETSTTKAVVEWTTHSATTTELTTTLGWVAAGEGQLYCFALMLPFGYEPGLLGMQYKQKVSLFACDEFAVFSNKSIEIAPGLNTHVVPINLKCDFGGEFGTALNTHIFKAIWAKVFSEQRFSLYKWSVKVDPDCVFLPSRLRTMLRPKTEGSSGTYLNNCKFGMHGPIEVYSSKAVSTLVNGWDRCDQHFTRLCSGDCWWGEDLFIDQCLKRVLKVDRDNEYGLLVEDHCDAPKDWKSCEAKDVVAFHPFKSEFGYQECLGNAEPPTESEVFFK